VVRSRWLTFLVGSGLTALVGCGGGGGGGGTVPPPLAPAVTLSASSLSFSAQAVGTSSGPLPVTLTNSGTAPLSITSISPGGDFAETNTCGSSIAILANCTISVTFIPTLTGSRTGSVSIVDNASNSPQTITLTGTGQAPAPAVSLSPSSLTFSSEPVGTTSAPQLVTLTNSGNASLSIVSISASGDFAETNGCGSSVLAGNNCTISVTFTPTTTCWRSGSVTITDNAGSPQTIRLSGGPNNLGCTTVDLGPAGNDADVLFVTITVCVPGSSNCQTIDHVSVDTGSAGLRILASQLNNLALPEEMSGTGSPLGNCVTFADNSYVWGPVVTADVQIAGEKATSVPTQIIIPPNSSNFPNVPTSCNRGGLADDTTATLGANALIGVSVFRQDCGPACSTGTTQHVYFSCPNSGCSEIAAPLLSQLQNPVWMFPQDNNGLLVTLPAIPDAGTTTANGNITFGIGTQSNNALGSATVVYTTNNQGNFTATYSNKSYIGYIDSGSNGLYLLDAATLGIADCTGLYAGWYCPASTTSFTFTNTGANSASGPVTIKIGNADTLFSNLNFAAYDDIGGSNPGTVDYGLPFFFGRTIFVGIEGQSSNGTFWAY
jgi:hypothetical protein